MSERLHPKTHEWFTEGMRQLAWYDELILYKIYKNEGFSTSELRSIPGMTRDKANHEFEKLSDAEVIDIKYEKDGNIYDTMAEAHIDTDAGVLQKFGSISEGGRCYLESKDIIE